MFSNILYDFGRWGVLWKTLIILALLSLVWPKIKNEAFLSYGILFYFILIFLFSFARIPYLSSWGDSSNRMLTHLVPIIIFFFALKFNLKWKDWNQLSDLLISSNTTNKN
ncbi:MAG: hypothetical protein OQL19_03175, partial [Gammaproteobacteria bacterium]|nr:hypothetical protein [Gammaproteobacteria bacterium]